MVVTLRVDASKPERHREVLIVPFQDHTHNGVLHNGFGVEITGADFTLFRDGLYRGWLTDTNKVVLQIPVGRSSLLRHVDNYQRERNRLGGHSDTYETARMVVVNRINAQEERQTYFLELVFPEEFELTNAVFTPANVPYGRITPQVTPVLTPVEISATRTINNIAVDIRFAVTIVEDEARVATAQAANNPDMEQINNAIQGMTFNP